MNVTKSGNKMKVFIPIVVYLVSIAVFSYAKVVKIHVLSTLAGIFALIFLPGYGAREIIDSKIRGNSNIVLSFVMGHMIQLLNTFLAWILYILFGGVNYECLIIALSTFEVVLLSYLNSRLKSLIGENRWKKANIDKVFIILSLVYYILSIYWLSYVYEPNSDGAAYLDVARNIVTRGKFESNMVMPFSEWMNIQWKLGGDLSIHSFAIYNIALGFLITGEISLLSAQVFLIFTGWLMMFIFYEFIKDLLGANIARIATFLLVVHPETLAYTTLVGGPEVTSALYTFLSLFFILISQRSKDYNFFALLAGVSLFLSWYTWYYNFYVLLSFLGIYYMYLLNKHEKNRTKLSHVLISYFCLSLFVFEFKYLPLLIVEHLKFAIQIPIIFILSIVVLYLKKKKHVLQGLISFIVSLSIVSLMFAVWVIVYDNAYPLRQFYSDIKPLSDNIRKDSQIFSQRIGLNNVLNYANDYWSTVRGYIGDVIIILALLSYLESRYIGEVILLSLFPLMHFSLYSIFANVDKMQPRYLYASSIFLYALAAITLDRGITSLFKTSDKNATSKKCKNILRASIGIIVIFLITCLYIYPLYDAHNKIVDAWKYKEIFGWNEAINWIQSNTPDSAIILSRSFNYHAWYLDRKIVGISEVFNQNMTLSDLKELIKKYRVNYLFIDARIYWLFPGLKDLYTNPPEPFKGKLIYQSTINNKKVLIYNVTDIAYSSDP